MGLSGHNHSSSIEIMLSPTEQKEAVRWFTTESVLSNLHYFRVHDYVELLAVVHLLPDFIKDHPKVIPRTKGLIAQKPATNAREQPQCILIGSHSSLEKSLIFNCILVCTKTYQNKSLISFNKKVEKSHLKSILNFTSFSQRFLKGRM